jgi:excisionase family DNA binding protein
MFSQYPDIVSVDDITEMLNIGKSSAYTLLRTQQLRHVRIGTKYIIPKQAVIDFVGGNNIANNQIVNGRLNHQSSKGVAI